MLLDEYDTPMQEALEAMDEYMNDVALGIFSSFELAKSAAKKDDPERFYHGFVLGLIVELMDRYEITPNRESGFGRYDIMLVPREPKQDLAIIIKFKVHKPKQEASLEDMNCYPAVGYRQKDEKCSCAFKYFSL